jgi:hypothetical protein
MTSRFVRSVIAGAVALAASAGSASAFAPSAPGTAIERLPVARAPVVAVHDRGNRANHSMSRTPRVVVGPSHYVRDGLCVTRQPVTGISCYRLLREQQMQQHHLQHHYLEQLHEHGPGCGHTPRYARRHNTLVLLGWF